MKIKVIASSSKGNCSWISDGSTNLLLDAGISIKEIQIGCDFQLSKVGACLITHCHNDHSKAAKDLVRKYGMDVYTSPGTINACQLSSHRVHPVSALDKFQVGTFTVQPFDTEHDAPEPLGFVLTSGATKEKLLYLTDSYYVKYRFNNLSHIMIECNYDIEMLQKNLMSGLVPQALAPRILKSHLNLDHLLEFLKANDLSKLQQIYLLHLSDSNSDEKKMKSAVQKLTGAEVYVC